MIIAIWLLSALSLVPQAPRDDPRPAVGRQLTEFLTAASHSPASADDKRIFNAFFADDVIYTRASGVVIHKTDIMKALDEPPKAGTPTSSYTGEDVDIRRVMNDDRVVIVAFRLVQRMSDGTLNQYRNTGTFVQRGGRWQAVAWQATPIPKP
ncbi:MAG TPA: nuclear transport factor 2 family protein [Vicinamibacterales bacterium]|nr:nuclear transport factor 2 family protein [Vicinamibacterales bacterium]